jgi:hypothetical protein
MPQLNPTFIGKQVVLSADAASIRTIVELGATNSPTFAGATINGALQLNGTLNLRNLSGPTVTLTWNGNDRSGSALFNGNVIQNNGLRPAFQTAASTLDGALPDFAAFNDNLTVQYFGLYKKSGTPGVMQVKSGPSTFASVELANLTASGTGSFGGSTNVYSFSSTHPLSAAPSTSWRFGSGWSGNYDTQFIFAYADNAAKVTIDTSGAITAFGGYYVNVPASSSSNIRPLQHGNSFLRFSAPASGIPGNNTTLEGWDSVFLNASTGNVRLRIGGADRLVLTNTDLTLTGNLTASGTITYSSIAFPELVTNGGFDTDTAWTKGANWTISGGTAVATGVASFADIQQNLPAVNAGQTYVITFTVTITSGTIAAYLGANGNGNSIISIIATSGSYSFLFHKNPLDTTKTILFRGNPTFNGTIDNVSVKRAF